MPLWNGQNKRIVDVEWTQKNGRCERKKKRSVAETLAFLVATESWSGHRKRSVVPTSISSGKFDRQNQVKICGDSDAQCRNKTEKMKYVYFLVSPYFGADLGTPKVSHVGLCAIIWARRQSLAPFTA